MDKDFLKDFLNRHIGEVRRKLASEGSFITDSTAESVIEDFLLDCRELSGLCARELGEIAGRLFLMTRRDMGM